jgi:hypothetical protein
VEVRGLTTLEDVRASGLSLSEAQRGFARSFGAYGHKLDRITVIGDDFLYGGGR